MMRNRVIEIEDLTRLTLVSDPQVSPAADKIAFNVTKMSLDEDEYISRIWVYDLRSEELYSLTNGPKDTNARWSRSGKYLAFTSRRTLKKEEKGSELWVLRLDGGEPRLIIKRKAPIVQIDWLPGDKRIAMISMAGEFQEDVKVIDRLLFWFNGKGFIHTFRQHLYLVDVQTGEVAQVTSGELDVNYIAVSNMGDKLAYIAKLDDAKPYVTDLFVYDLKSGEQIKLTNSNMFIDFVSWSPNDKKLVFRGHNFRRGTISHRHIYVVPTDGGEIVDLTANIDRNTINTLNSDVRGPGGTNGPRWLRNYVYFIVHDSGSVNLHRINIDTGEVEAVTKGKRSVEAFTVADNDGEHVVAFTSMNELEPPELYVWRSGLGEVKLTSFNEALLSKLKLTKPINFKCKASDGAWIEGWVLKPPEMKSDKAPTVLYIHGGPKTAYGYSFIHEFHLIAAKGYALIYMNPRGSDGYSEEFADIRGHYGERDYKDIMEGLEYAIANFNFIDGDRLGVIGGSYGGFMVNWIVGQTNRFKAAVSMRGISNWFSFYGVSDIGYWFTLDHILGGLEKKPLTRENIMKMIEKSPITYAENVSTPLLILHSIEDLRCYYEQALQFFTALKWLGKEVELVLVPKENHDLSRSGKPKHRIERLKQVIKWLDKYLKEKKEAGS